MFIPFISKRASRSSDPPQSRRKRAGGGGSTGAGGGRPSTGGGSGGGRPSTGGSTGGGKPSTGGSTGGGKPSTGGGTSSGKPGTGSGSGSSTPRPAFSLPSSSGSGSGSLKTSTYGQGGGLVSTVPKGLPFAGRTLGGGTRDGVFGSRTFGSGFSDRAGARGVRGAGLPYYFWPLAWGAGLGYGAGYLHDNEFGFPDNTTRPGGALAQVAIVSSPPPESTYHVVADNSTLAALIGTITESCGKNITNKPLRSAAFTGSPDDPRPESAIQYYRASSVVLTLDGYNNTAALNDDANLPDTPLPTGINTAFLDCLNRTIGASVPLVDAVQASSSPDPSGPVMCSTPTCGYDLNDGRVAGAPWWLLIGSLVLGLRATFC